MAYKDFINDFKKELTGNFLVFTGAEDYLMEWSADQVIARYVDESSRSIDVKILDGERTSAYDILGESRSFSMFSEKRVIIVRNFLPMYRKSADPGLDALIEAGSGNNKTESTSIVIFMLEARHLGEITSFGKKLIKACHGYDFSRLERAELKSFVTRRLKDAGKIIGRNELEYLIDLTGYYNKDSAYDLTLLDGDVSKIVKASESDTISAGLIEELLIGDNDRFVFDLVDAVVKGDRATALEIAETIIREEDGSMAVIALLTKQFEIMYDSLELSDKGYSLEQIAKSTGVNQFRLKKAYRAAMAYSKSKIKTLLIDLYNIDRDIKRGDIDKDVALELFVVSAAPVRR